MSSRRDDRHYRRSRSRSPTSRHHGDDPSSRRHNRHDRPRRSPSPKQSVPVLLPSNSKPLDIQTSLPAYFALFAKYLDIQKSVNVMDIDERELRSRFKRFVGRWDGRDDRRSKDKDDDRREKNRDRERDRSHRDKGRDRHRDKEEEREGRGDRDRSRRHGDSRIGKKNDDQGAETRDQAESRIRGMTDEELTRALQKLERENTPSEAASEDVEMKDGNESDDSDMIGPAIPESLAKPKAGAKPPTTQDLELQRELDEEESDLRRADLRYERKKERKMEKERLEELVPRAEAGSRERQLEKKRETAAANKAFADAKGGDVEEVGESTLMGGEESFQHHKAAQERKKNERELRKEALLRARKAEREERLQVHRAKEEQTMKMLRALADKFR
ncbi:hypothetical protein TWF970_006802 [Orbilia oligospora]|uniref:Uncharacterized protein n=1 Tax=Orbilia oligospora TaxID=2813651 RepID=A0A7C8R5F9_ORBOL|nr:hypothetical protein TWF970_006802 [Orbilia oligospora]